ncbi:hypothetical protein M422DRAFT_268016 [Sphaerobolus stellatus SS14]|uniref:Uncharacterized protein n=1 Tax=Sphaerobolus stellatus (strain SS14) TaxID=990650 RepID=A0A0C9UYK1_SPHS4|nr:hypothetical protein M422DRAFT_268016 [Sphaerobolus stellatus SS14]
MKNKKVASTPKSALIIEESTDEAVGDKELEIAANCRMLREKGITIVTEDQLNLGFLEVDLDFIKETVGDLRDLAHIQVMSQLLTYHLYDLEVKARPPGFHVQWEEYHHWMKIFREDPLGNDVGMLGDVEDRDEEEVLGIEEIMGVVQEETLGQVEGSDRKSGNELCEGSDEGSDEESGEELETESEKVTPKAKAEAVAKIMESEELEETSETASGKGEGSDKESDKVLAVGADQQRLGIVPELERWLSLILGEVHQVQPQNLLLRPRRGRVQGKQ